MPAAIAPAALFPFYPAYAPASRKPAAPAARTALRAASNFEEAVSVPLADMGRSASASHAEATHHQTAEVESEKTRFGGFGWIQKLATPLAQIVRPQSELPPLTITRDPHLLLDKDSFRHWLRQCGLLNVLDNAPDPNRTQALMLNPQRIILTARDPEGRLQGAVYATHHGNEALVHLLGVMPQAQGHGVGTQLLKALQEETAAMVGGPTQLILVSATGDGGKAMHYYENRGFSKAANVLFLPAGASLKEAKLAKKAAQGTLPASNSGHHGPVRAATLSFFA